jgi:hypothetical protein
MLVANFIDYFVTFLSMAHSRAVDNLTEAPMTLSGRNLICSGRLWPREQVFGAALEVAAAMAIRRS